MDLALFLKISLLTFLISHIYIRYLKYIPRFRIFKGIFQEYYYCYACVGFWISLFIILIVRPEVSDSFLFAILGTIGFLYNFETSVLFSKLREEGVLVFSPVLIAVILAALVFLVSLKIVLFSLPLVFSFVNVFYKELYERIWGGRDA
ncbi:hypothetical protein TMA_046 [Thermus phage TMA]|uniref:hypothetical protein n=1 Tax=Thermus phage TMA TaxID=699370 RepID=UPI00021AAE3F|nr:hypothetical protein TMA_046 [Thermus phage TMA]BAK53734.1 hypothetical protein TMA_046 [Thermus phage TMA]